jgi:hypothetical protein
MERKKFKMKKVFVALVALVMVLTMAVPAWADDDSPFVSSPTTNQAPTVSEAKDEAGNSVTVTVTSFGKRDDLPAESSKKLETAYQSIVQAEKVATLNDDITKVAQDKKVKTDNLAVSDLFDIDLGTPDAQGNVTVNLEVESLDNFVCLLHFNGESWDVVDNAKVEGGKLTFSMSAFSPFAIVVDAGADTTASASGLSGGVIALIVILCILVLAAVVALVVFLSRKNHKGSAA